MKWNGFSRVSFSTFNVLTLVVEIRQTKLNFTPPATIIVYLLCSLNAKMRKHLVLSKSSLSAFFLSGVATANHLSSFSPILCILSHHIDKSRFWALSRPQRTSTNTISVSPLNLSDFISKRLTLDVPLMYSWCCPSSSLPKRTFPNLHARARSSL